MARSGINKVILVGNLGQDPEVRFTAGGAAVTTLSLATSESWKDKETGQDQEKTEWHRVVLWNRLAENAGEYLKKGSKVYSDSINLITVESNISRELGKLQKKYKKYIDIGSYPFFRLGRVGVSIVLRSQNKHKISLCKKDILKNIVKKKKIKKV